ncbi:hypothetical protein Acor_84110 [Acrocarpospora corrugata]|uniref:Vegetative cell wall protein gp1 n=1 Tax=Acrocarpospora corrugata TaxID=35763 RepID=A0A5M3WE35_9ACTN|nr:hypothetical protein [Acrocarpospora corrugata]GES06342.1 hypothetical protein Acor_84110 [Acrocarpospora corrugata]
MTGFLGEVGKKIAERWVGLLALPGLLFLAAVITAWQLGYAHALDPAPLGRQITAWSTDPGIRTVGGLVLIMVVCALSAVGVGLVASALGRAVEWLWTIQGACAPARWLVTLRRRRWERAVSRAESATTAGAAARAIAQADRICLREPDRPCWIGDRLRVPRVRVEEAYGLDLDACWPRLWLIVPEEPRLAVGAARESLATAARLVGWSSLYLLLALWWWPGAVIGAVLFGTGWSQARAAATALAELVEATVDLHVGDLNDRLAPARGVAPGTGRALTTLLRKSRWDPDYPEPAEP